MGEYDNLNLPIAEAFKWPRKIPIWWDPVPPWFFDRVKLPTEIMTQLALTQMEFEHSILENQMKASKKAMEILSKMK